MPMTLPTHPAAVVPLKVWRPRWFDGVALAVGSTAPDVAYAFDGFGVTIRSHSWHGLLWWCVPVTLLGTWLIRRAAPVVAAHLPDGGPFRLRDYGVLGSVRHRWYVTAWSALLGAASHNVWDAVTHRTMERGVVFFPVLLTEAFAGTPWWAVLKVASDVVGPAALLVVAVHIGRSRLLAGWHGTAPAPAPRQWLFWGTAASAVAAVLAAVPFLPGDPGRHVVGVRVICAVAGALLVAAAAARWVGTRSGRSDNPAATEVPAREH